MPFAIRNGFLGSSPVVANPTPNPSISNVPVPVRLIEEKSATDGEGQVASEEELEIACIKASGLLELDWYLQRYPDVTSAGIDPLEHFCLTGSRESRRPNRYFDPEYYRRQLPDTEEAPKRALVHYITKGEALGLRPVPYFDPLWYKVTYELTDNETPLAHYLACSTSGLFSPIPEFDVKFYLAKNPDVRKAGVDPFFHFLESGFLESRNPSSDFDVDFYRKRHLGNSPDENPLVHYLLHRQDTSLLTQPSKDEAVWSRELKKFTMKGRRFEEFEPVNPLRTPRAKVFAFYLPQFHAFPENDNWWGKGFTEWTNIARGASRFEGHYQPRIPRDLGFYNLTDPEPMRQQINLAKQAGIFGFVFYFYWFNGRRLMEKPLENFLNDAEMDFPFCLMWANENWTRRWDGLENDLLIRQDYADEDDIGLVNTFLASMKDPRYYRIRGRPVLMIYRPGIIPDAVAKFSSWRNLFKRLGDENPILVMAQGFGDIDPRQYALDGAIEFPPHKVVARVNHINANLNCLDPDFSGHAFSYDEVVAASIAEETPEFPLIRTAFPSWDNDARRQGKGMVIHGGTPDSYRAWLEQLISRASRQTFFGEKLVCINAWNEWAEGAYLEPDVHFGSAYLNATSRAIYNCPDSDRKKMCLVGHDAHRHGAQFLLQHVASVLTRQFGLEIEIVLLGGGPMTQQYKAIANTTVAATADDLFEVFGKLSSRGFRHAIINTSAAARAVTPASLAGFELTVLVHELPSLIREKGLQDDIERSLSLVNRFVFAAAYVRDKFLTMFDISLDRTVILPQGSYAPVTFSPSERTAVRASIGVSGQSPLALGVGYADLRKGFDLFLRAWHRSEEIGADIHFVWVGLIDQNIYAYLALDIELAKASGRFHLVGFESNIGKYFSAADVFILTSREDPFPTVVLEAIQSGMPTVAFAGAGGIPEMLVNHRAGTVVPFADTTAMVKAILDLHACHPQDARTAGNRLSRVGHEAFNFKDYAHRLLEKSFETCPKISVVVPNYNYARYLAQRMTSIFQQTHPVFEIIVLDDCSTDKSTEVLDEVCAQWHRSLIVVKNAENSGSVFRQWKKGVELARGDYVWIAEADDSADPDFLSLLAKAVVSNAETVLAYADSRAVDENGVELSDSYKFYFEQSSPGVFKRDRVFDSIEYVKNHLGERNLILNVSCCLWRREALLLAMDELGTSLFDFRVAGDWFIYINALSRAGTKVAYVSKPVNVHRRHANSVTHSLNAKRHFDEISKLHDAVRTLVGFPPGLKERQDRYRREVENTLNLASEVDAPLVDISLEP